MLITLHTLNQLFSVILIVLRSNLRIFLLLAVVSLWRLSPRLNKWTICVRQLRNDVYALNMHFTHPKSVAATMAWFELRKRRGWRLSLEGYSTQGAFLCI